MLARLLTERSWTAIPEAQDRGEVPALIAAATQHGIAVLLAGRARESDPGGPIHAALAGLRREEALLEEIRGTEIRRVIAALAGAGIPALLFKGTPLAYSHYAAPWDRPRFDTDVFVDERAVPPAVETLGAAGYAAAPLISSPLLMAQVDYRRVDRHGIEHRIDLHWELCNPQVFRGLFSFDELNARAVPVETLGPPARAFEPADALLAACVHRIAHHGRLDGDDRLIWLYDVHVLMEGLTPDAALRFIARAREKRVALICADALRRCQELFGTRMPGALAGLHPRAAEPSAAFLRNDRHRLDVLASDLRALTGWRARGRLLAEHLFPDPAFMRRSYGVSTPLLLPFCYVHRAARGAVRWLRERRA